MKSPVPWKVETKPVDVWDADGRLVHLGLPGCFNNDDDWNKNIANARLIAAAPDLLAACKLAVLNYSRQFASGEVHLDDDHEVYEACKAAIARAEEVV